MTGMHQVKHGEVQEAQCGEGKVGATVTAAPYDDLTLETIKDGKFSGA